MDNVYYLARDILVGIIKKKGTVERVTLCTKTSNFLTKLGYNNCAMVIREALADLVNSDVVIETKRPNRKFPDRMVYIYSLSGETKKKQRAWIEMLIRLFFRRN